MSSTRPACSTRRMRPRIAPRSDDALSLQAEIGRLGGGEALRRRRGDAADIDMVICAASNMQRPYPAMAVEIQGALGAGGYAFDMNVACSSATFGLEQAINAVKTGSARAALVISPEICSATWPGRIATATSSSATYYGAGRRARRQCRAGQGLGSARHEAGDQLLEQHPQQRRVSRPLRRPRPERARPALPPGGTQGVQGSPMAADHIAGHLASLGFTAGEVRRFWLHQANLAMNQLIGRRLLGREASADEAPVILDEFANTASAGSIIAFHRQCRSQGRRPRRHLFLRRWLFDR